MASSKLQRKPVSTAAQDDITGLDWGVSGLSLDTKPPLLDEPDAQFVLSPQSTVELEPGAEVLEVTAPVTTATNRSNNKSLTFKTAIEDVRHFAGGLISHPYEASEHYSVLRHSHGLVYFKGFNTNVAITIFGDQSLPDDRKFWLQKRGYSGRAGLKIGASIFGTKGAWINVTPTTRCKAEHLPASDERAWQRDIAKFLKKTDKHVKNHSPLETCILRIPCNAEDGYFRVLLCTGDKGKKTLCPSPIFRLVSTSTSMGSLRGASLSTMPLELGIKIGQFAARQVAVNAAAPMAGQAVQQAKSMVPWQPSFVQQQAASIVQGSAQAQLQDAHARSEEMEQTKVDQYAAQMQENLDHAQMVGPETGPEQPYPLRFSAKVMKVSEYRQAELGVPTASLSGVPDDVTLRLSGTYLGWATITGSKTLDLDVDDSDGWYQIILSATARSDTQASVVMKKNISMYLLTDDCDIELVGAKLSLLVMGRLRPSASRHLLDDTKNIEEEVSLLLQDIATTQASLNRPEWGPGITLQRVRTDKSSRSFNERYADARNSVQKEVDKVPVHWAGVRTDSMTLRDCLVGNGGVWVIR